MIKNDMLVPYKEKPVDRPLPLSLLLKSDRAGHTFDAKVGFHKNVAEVDFSSMFPWIMHNKNVSADAMMCSEGPFEQVPGLPIKISHKFKGLVPLALKPILDRRMFYKRNPTTLNRKRAEALKYVLVTAYGYLRFREFKLGIASSHMATCAYAREILLQAAGLAEEKGFEVVHGIIDSMYLKRKDLSEEEVRELCREIEQLTGIPVSFEGLFKWIVFLPSINDAYRPLPARYFGAYAFGGVKARGIEVRQKNVPELVKKFQEKVLEEMSLHSTKKEIVEKVPDFCSMLREIISNLDNADASLLSCRVNVSKTSYANDIPQKRVIQRLKKKGIPVLPGQRLQFIFSRRGVVLLEEYKGNPDREYYARLLVRSLFVLLQPLGISVELIEELTGKEKQTRLPDFVTVTHHYIPLSKEYADNKGLSEHLLKKRLEKSGWIVWRGGSIHILRQEEIFPNVLKKYSLLRKLMDPVLFETLEYFSSTHHGMPDFLCFRNGMFKFVECKFRHEQLSDRQKKCIARLQNLGFTVEVHKLVDHQTKLRLAQVNIATNDKKVLEKQCALR
jgi:DNA polymerase-2